MMETVTFGDCVLSDFGIVTDIRRSTAGIEPVIESVSGRDGGVVRGVRLTQPEVSCLLVAKHVGMHDRRRMVRLLSPKLLGKELQTLSFSSDEGLTYRAMLSQRPDFSEYVNAGTMRLTFFVDGAHMEGRTVGVDVSGTTRINVEGTYPTPLRISGTATPSNGYFGIRMDDGDFIHVKMDDAASVEIDCEARTCKVAGVTRQITLDSDWLVPEPAEHTLSFDNGSGSLRVEWTERWL